MSTTRRRLTEIIKSNTTIRMTPDEQRRHEDFPATRTPKTGCTGSKRFVGTGGTGGNVPGGRTPRAERNGDGGTNDDRGGNGSATGPAHDVRTRYTHEYYDRDDRDDQDGRVRRRSGKRAAETRRQHRDTRRRRVRNTPPRTGSRREAQECFVSTILNVTCTERPRS